MQGQSIIRSACLVRVENTDVRHGVEQAIPSHCCVSIAIFGAVHVVQLPGVDDEGEVAPLLHR